MQIQHRDSNGWFYDVFNYETFDRLCDSCHCVLCKTSGWISFWSRNFCMFHPKTTARRRSGTQWIHIPIQRSNRRRYKNLQLWRTNNRYVQCFEISFILNYLSAEMMHNTGKYQHGKFESFIPHIFSFYNCFHNLFEIPQLKWLLLVFHGKGYSCKPEGSTQRVLLVTGMNRWNLPTRDSWDAMMKLIPSPTGILLRSPRWNSCGTHQNATKDPSFLRAMKIFLFYEVGFHITQKSFVNRLNLDARIVQQLSNLVSAKIYFWMFVEIYWKQKYLSLFRETENWETSSPLLWNEISFKQEINIARHIPTTPSHLYSSCFLTDYSRLANPTQSGMGRGLFPDRSFLPGYLGWDGSLPTWPAVATWGGW